MRVWGEGGPGRPDAADGLVELRLQKRSMQVVKERCQDSGWIRISCVCHRGPMLTPSPSDVDPGRCKEVAWSDNLASEFTGSPVESRAPSTLLVHICMFTSANAKLH